MCAPLVPSVVAAQAGPAAVPLCAPMDEIADRRGWTIRPLDRTAMPPRHADPQLAREYEGAFPRRKNVNLHEHLQVLTSTSACVMRVTMAQKVIGCKGVVLSSVKYVVASPPNLTRLPGTLLAWCPSLRFDPAQGADLGSPSPASLLPA